MEILGEYATKYLQRSRDDGKEGGEFVRKDGERYLSKFFQEAAGELERELSDTTI